jgi:NAD(P)-dependent dehydrogenase (short-subunit alcohol dehydrogenase family)
VTGSASGIGRATAERLARDGARVIGVDLRDADVVADLSTPDGRAALVDGVRNASGGTIDAVVACAGVEGVPAPLIVKVNYFGAVATLVGLRPLLAQSDSPRAVAVSSLAQLHPVDDELVDACLAGDEDRAAERAGQERVNGYTSSKRALGRWLRRTAPGDEWAGAGIPLNAVAPGTIRTPIVESHLATEEGRRRMERWVPMPLHGPGEASDVADLIAWLAGPQNVLVTGQVIFIDGGADAVLRGDDVW